MRCDVSGGVVALLLNHRLMAVIPPGWDGPDLPLPSGHGKRFLSCHTGNRPGWELVGMRSLLLALGLNLTVLCGIYV